MMNPDLSKRTASSTWDSDTATKGSHFQSLLGENSQAWSAQHNRKGEWLQLDAGNASHWIAGIVVQSRNNDGNQ